MLLLWWHWRWSESSLLRPRFHPYGTGQHTVISDEPLVIRSCEHTDSCLTVVLCFSLPRRLLKSELGSFISDYFQVSSGAQHPSSLQLVAMPTRASFNPYSYTCCSGYGGWWASVLTDVSGDRVSCIQSRAFGFQGLFILSKIATHMGSVCPYHMRNCASETSQCV